MARWLLVLHAGAATLLVGALVHEAWWASRYLARRFDGARRERWFLRLSALVFVLDFLVGCLVYPTYKVHVRGAWLDLYRPDVARLFDIKEHLLAWVLAMLLGLVVLSRLAPPERHRHPLLLRLHAGLAGCCAALTVLAGMIGFYTATFQGLPR